MPTQIISVSKQFSREPAGRYSTDGEQSGETFRERLLIPALEKGLHVIVNLDGVEGYGSSFLEEAFAGAMRRLGMSEQQFNERVSFVATEDPSLLLEVAGYLRDQEQRRLSRRG